MVFQHLGVKLWGELYITPVFVDFWTKKRQNGQKRGARIRVFHRTMSQNTRRVLYRNFKIIETRFLHFRIFTFWCVSYETQEYHRKTNVFSQQNDHVFPVAPMKKVMFRTLFTFCPWLRILFTFSLFIFFTFLLLESASTTPWFNGREAALG